LYPASTLVIPSSASYSWDGGTDRRPLITQRVYGLRCDANIRLFNGAKTGHLAMVRQLLSEGADINWQNTDSVRHVIID
jgi:hypothetical protein